MTEEARFTVISFNVRDLVNTTHVNELTMFLTTHKPSCLIIQEPQIDHRTTITKNGKARPHTPVPVPKFTGYASLHFTHPTKPTGVVFYIHKSCTYNVSAVLADFVLLMLVTYNDLPLLTTITFITFS